MNERLAQLQDALAQARQEVAKVIVGHEIVVERALAAIFTGNHALIEGVPGVAKTLLVRTLAHVLGCEFNRIQFTPDLMPADIIGTNIFSVKDSEFKLVKGPLFTTFLLADEINRAPAKTQSALLQAMQERRVTIDRETYSLSPDFTVFATQNPIEYEGTYPLPEAQIDRFMLKIAMEPPSREEEILLAGRTLGDNAPETVLASGVVRPVLHDIQLVELRAALQAVSVQEELTAYAVDIVRKTRTHASVLVGAGPRAMQSLLLAGRVQAAMQGRDFITPDDIKVMTRPTLEHRLILRPEYEIEGLTCGEVLEQVLQEVTVPR